MTDLSVEDTERPDADDVLAAAAIMVGTLLGESPDDRREWLNDLVAQQGATFPGAERLQTASEKILREVDNPMSQLSPRRKALRDTERPDDENERAEVELRNLAEAVHRLNVDWEGAAHACGDATCKGDCRYVREVQETLDRVLGTERVRDTEQPDKRRWRPAQDLLREHFNRASSMAETPRDRLSHCCKANVRLGGGIGPTKYYVCTWCEKACGVGSEDIEQEHER